MGLRLAPVPGLRVDREVRPLRGLGIRNEVDAAGAATPTRRVLLLLFLFLVALYSVTSGGHTASFDEDEMVYVAQGLADRGDPALPQADGQALGAMKGPDGRYYSKYQPLESVLAIPFYKFGSELAQLFPPQYHDFIARITVDGVDAVITAAAAVLLALIALELGFSLRVAVVLALIFGTSTIAWPYSKYFWSEPVSMAMLSVAALCAIRASRRHSFYWGATAVGLGLAVLTHLLMIASIPAFALYFCLSAVAAPQRARSVVVRALLFALPLLVPVAVIGGYNVFRFGLALPSTRLAYYAFLSRLQTVGLGQAFAPWAGNVAQGIAGLLFSSGKSAFLYSPPLAAGVIALPLFVRRFPREGSLVVVLSGTLLVMAGSVAWWHGDPGWGPRYLVPITPFLLLPAATWLQRRDGDSFGLPWPLTVLVVLGVVVQLFAVTYNYDGYVFSTGNVPPPRELRRWFDPAWSPLLQAPKQLIQRFESYEPLRPGQVALGEGFYGTESAQFDLPRWTAGRASLSFYPRASGPGAITLEFDQTERGTPRPVPDIALVFDGQAEPLPLQEVFQPRPGHYLVRTALPDLTASRHSIAVVSPTFVPAVIEGSTDTRVLGVRLVGLGMSDSRGPIQFVGVRARVTPLPVSMTAPWSRSTFSWFFDDRMMHLIDIWPWYVANSGLPPILALVVVVPLAAAGWLAYLLRRWLSTGQPPLLSPFSTVPGRALCFIVLPLPVLAIGLASYQSHAAPSDPTGVRLPAAPITLGVDRPHGLLEGAPSTSLMGHAWATDGSSRPFAVSSVDVYVGSRVEARFVGRAQTGEAALQPPASAATAAPSSGWRLTLPPLAPSTSSPFLVATAYSVVGQTTRQETTIEPVISPGTYGFAPSFYGSESTIAGQLPRWTNGRGVLLVAPVQAGPLTIDLEFEQRDFELEPGHRGPDIRLLWNGSPSLPGGWTIQRLETLQGHPPSRYRLTVNLDVGGGHELDELTLLSPTFVPRDKEPNSTDTRELGIFVQSLSVSQGTHAILAAGSVPSSSLLTAGSVTTTSLLDSD